MFRSARLKLTLFYLGIIVLFNLMVTLSVRVFAEHEFLRSNVAQRSEVREWAVRLLTTPPRRTDAEIDDIQSVQNQLVREHLNSGLLIINLCAMAVGGILSYWFAGRTLRPIEEAHDAQARFTADASHELRTPLANMRLENEVFLRQKHFTEAEGREQIESNLEEIQRLERLSSNLLALHQYGQASITRTPAAITKIVDDAVASVKSDAKAKKVAITVEVAPSAVYAHHESTVQLMDILLDNALKYGMKGGTVTIKGEARSSRYILSVIDKGPGLAAHDIPYLFDRLYRGDKARSTKIAGYGLGLALAKEIAQVNGATITARNNTSGGARFDVMLERIT
jgi:signal transduction histidine kinase